MAKRLQLRRGTTANHGTFTGAVGEITIDTDKDVVVVHDGATAGGFPLAKQTSVDSKVAKVTSTDNAIVSFNGTSGDIQNSTVLIDDNGNLNITGTGKRITGDFSNGTPSNRVAFQTSTSNSPTSLTVMPNGTGAFTNIEIHKYADINNGSYLNLAATSDATISIRSSVYGTGTYLPMTFHTGGSERMRIDTAGNVLVTGSGGLGYGTGSGGTVTQLTSKATAVTLNKPTGRITMNNAALAAGAAVAFTFVNNTISATDNVNVISDNGNYIVWATRGSGGCGIWVKNNHTVSLSDALVLNFTIIKGAIS